MQSRIKDQETKQICMKTWWTIKIIIKNLKKKKVNPQNSIVNVFSNFNKHK